MARRRHRNRDALIDGLIGAGIGALNFKLSEASQRRMEEAEAIKEQRLAAIRAAESERANQFQTQRDATLFENQSTLTDKQLAAQAERDRAEQASRMQLASVQGEQRMREIGAQGASQMAIAREGRAPDVQTFRDAKGVFHQVPLGDNAALAKLQQEQGALELVEGSRGGRFSALPDNDAPAGAGLMGGGVPGRSGAASPTAPSPSFIWDQKTQRLVPAR